ncbi:MAG TPA: 4Fe-4S binding protein [Clostridia bacterium]|nr:4Fe-4S binding protein [Clostridia bacterium]
MFFRNNKPIANEKAKLIVKLSRCPQNHPCPSVKVCPVGALLQQGYAAPTVDEDKCIKCGKCVKFCPMKALQFE